MTSELDTAKRRAPVSAYVLMAATAAAMTLGSGALAGWTRAGEQGFWLPFAVSVLVTAPVALALGWVVFVSGHTVQRDRHPEDNVETRWFREATSAAFLDVVAVAGIALVVVSTGWIALPGDKVLLAVVASALLDATVRLWALWRQGG